MKTLSDEDLKVLAQIKGEFDKVHQSNVIQGQKNWTKEFLKGLKRIGIEKKYKVYSSSAGTINKENGGGEWLFDLCWSIEGLDENGWVTNYKGLKLICESEWSMKIKEILYDFQKLAVAKAGIKIMIIQYSGEEDYYKIKTACEASVDETLYNDESCCYYLMGSSNNPNDSSSVKFEQLWFHN